MKQFYKDVTQLLNKQQTYLVATSFGPDSMFLVDYLRAEGYRIALAHVNYRKRQESDDEQKQLEAYAQKFNLPLEAYVLSEPLKGNFQAEARKLRYDFFTKVAEKYNITTLLTGHHNDDHLESALFQFNRKAMVRYYGIRQKTKLFGLEVIRPMLSLSKEDILKENHDRHIPFALDASNETQIYTRNKIRAQIKKLSSQAKNQLQLDIEDQNKVLINAENKILPFTNKASIKLLEYQSLSSIEQFMYWVLVFEQNNIVLNVGRQFLNKMMKLTTSEKPNIVVTLNVGWRIYKSYDHFRLMDINQLAAFDVKARMPKVIDLPMFTIDLHYFNKRPFPVRIRSPKAGDVYEIYGVEKSLRRLFIDWKMPLYLRGVWPVFLDSFSKITYIPRYRNSGDWIANNWLSIKE
jgi:bifunctional protein TilS/HprT